MDAVPYGGASHVIAHATLHVYGDATGVMDGVADDVCEAEAPTEMLVLMLAVSEGVVEIVGLPVMLILGEGVGVRELEGVRDGDSGGDAVGELDSAAVWVLVDVLVDVKLGELDSEENWLGVCVAELVCDSDGVTELVIEMVGEGVLVGDCDATDVADCDATELLLLEGALVTDTVGVLLGVAPELSVDVPVDVPVFVLLGVRVREGVAVAVDVEVDVPVAVDVEVDVPVDVDVPVAVPVDVDVPVAVDVPVDVDVLVDVAVSVAACSIRAAYADSVSRLRSDDAT